MSRSEIPTYSVIYDGNGNTSGSVPIDSNTYRYGEIFHYLDKGDLEKDRCTFLGWSKQVVTEDDNISGGSTYSRSGTPDFMEKEDVTYYAVWSYPTCFITFDFNYDEAPINTVELTNKDSFTVSYTPSSEGSFLEKDSFSDIYHINIPEDISNQGKVIIDWNTSPDGMGVSYPSGENVDEWKQKKLFDFPTEGKDLTLYAIWEDSTEDLQFRINRWEDIAPPEYSSFTPESDVDCYVSVKYLGSRSDIVIPRKYNGFPVIRVHGFNYADYITSVDLPESILFIEASTFYGTHISSIELPEGLLYIGHSAFEDIDELRSITIPSTVTHIGQGAFHNEIYSIDGIAIVPGILTVTSLCETPPVYLSSYFEHTIFPSYASTIHVPADSVELYKQAEGWNHYSNYIEAISD